ncbi:MAG: CARDB domain-containing protein [Salinirussus sp.]
MGFSVSGTAVIVLTALLVAFGMWSTAAANSLEQVTESHHDAADRQLERTNTAVAISSASQSGSTVSFNIENEGTVSWYVSEIDVIVDGTYKSDWTVGGSSNLIRPGQSRGVRVGVSGTADRVKVVTPTGPSAVSEVS